MTRRPENASFTQQFSTLYLDEGTSMKHRICIKRDGVRVAIQTLLPRVREAGQLAAALQPLIQKTDAPPQKEGEHIGHTSLTHADILLEDRLGSDVLMLFEDASFFGEEHAHDRISRFIPMDHPFIITVDPINGTWMYSGGLPLYETIVTICDRDWNILGAIVYRPIFDEAFIAWNEGGSAQTQHVHWNDMVVTVQDVDLSKRDVPARLHLDRAWHPHESLLRNAGCELVDIWSDYAGQMDWPYSQADVLLGKCRAMAWKGRWSTFIDAAVFCFVVECAKGVWRRGSLDREKLVYSYTIAATDVATADLLEGLIDSVAAET